MATAPSRSTVEQACPIRPVVLASIGLLLAAAPLACSAAAGRDQLTGTSSTTGAGGSGPASSASTASGSTTSSTGTGGSGHGGGTGLGGGFNIGDGGPGGGPPGCSAAAELVYVFGLDNNIYSFDPPNKVFTKIATPDCGASGMPNSMAIDRNLVAWLNYIGALYKFDLNTKTGCTKAVTLPTGYQQVGMGFSADMPGGTAETLYIDAIGNTPGTGLASYANNKFAFVGNFGNDPNLQGQSCELTGTGDAKLFGYFNSSPVRVAQIDKTNGNIILEKALNTVPAQSDWAFSFWGGDFYLYAAPGAPGTNATGNSTVIHYSPSTQTVDTAYVADVGFKIIGAGVTTCAPLMPPK